MGSIRRRAAGVLAAAALALTVTAAPAAAQMQVVETTIDLDYTYEQEHAEGNVNARTGFLQKYEVRLDTTLSSSFDFMGAISVDLDDQWDSNEATTSKISPNLELGIKGPQSGAHFTYAGVKSKTDEYEETAESTQYSNTYDLDLELTPYNWPEIKLQLQETSDYEEGRTDTSSRTWELQVRDEFYNVDWEFSLKLDKTFDTMPEDSETNATDWSWKATYQETLFRDVDFELAYEIKESYAEDSTRNVFTGDSEEYTQNLKGRVKKSLELSPLLTTGVSWEYEYEQDLLELDYDYRVRNKYTLDVRYDVLPSLKVTGEATRETERENGTEGVDDISKVTDTIRGAFDYDLATWLRIGGKAEKKFESSIEVDTGGSVDHTDDEQFELIARNKFRDFWELTMGASTNSSHTEGVLQDRETKFKADLKLTLLDLDWVDANLMPMYEASRTESWDERGDPTGETSTSDVNIKFEARAKLLKDLLEVTFSHEYGQKITRETDEVLDYTRELGYNEDTRLNLAISDLFDGLDLEGEVERKADDTEGDSEPQIVEISYSFKLDWNYEELSLSSAFKYTDKGDDPDEADFTAKIGWSGERIDVSGDYQFTKTYSDLTDEDRKLNLKLSYNF